MNIAVSLGLRYYKEILLGLVLVFGVVFVLFFGAVQEQGNTGTRGGGVMPGADGKGGKANVPPVVRQYEGMIREIATKYNLQDYTEFFLAQVMQESGGTDVDIFQSSESIDGNLGNIRSPEHSTEQAMRHWTDVIGKSQAKGLDFWAATQAYNMGPGYLFFLDEIKQKHSEDSAKAFALKHAGGRTSCRWRSPYCYGDYTYLNKILKYFQPATGTTGNSEIGSDRFNKLMSFALQFENYPYQWGGVGNPSFDCSGLWMMAFRQVGITLPRTAGEQYKATQRVSKEQLQPGDLVFFTGTSDHAYISHVGLYVGNGRMFDSNSRGIGYTDLNKAYWDSKIAGYGRVGG